MPYHSKVSWAQPNKSDIELTLSSLLKEMPANAKLINHSMVLDEDRRKIYVSIVYKI